METQIPEVQSKHGNHKMKQTDIFQKLIPSIINVFVVFIITIPVLLIRHSYSSMIVIWVWTFFLYNLFFIIVFKNRDLGMMIVKTYWKKDYPIANQLLFAILYTLSFATLFIWIWFPFDLFIFNMVCVQLPFVLLTGTTLHGYLSGKMVTVTDRTTK